MTGLLIYALGGVLVYGMTLGYLMGEFSSYNDLQHRKDVGVAAMAGILWPFSIIIVSIFSGLAAHGLRWR